MFTSNNDKCFIHLYLELYILIHWNSQRTYSKIFVAAGIYFNVMLATFKEISESIYFSKISLVI